MNRNDADLAHRFAQATPTAPDTTVWGLAARRRNTRRRTVAASLCAGGVVVGLSVALVASGRLGAPNENVPIASDGPARNDPVPTGSSSPAPEGRDILVTNSTAASLWVFTPWGNQFDVAPGKTVTLGSGCTRAVPLRVETLGGEVLDYYETCTPDARWDIDSLTPFIENDPATVGTVTGTLTLRTSTTSEPVVHAGVTFTGPVVRTASVGRQGLFLAALPEGVYTIEVASSAIPPGPAVTACPTSATLTVQAGSTSEIDLYCDR